MGRRPAKSSAAAPTRGRRATRRGVQEDEARVRTYLRLLVEAPVRASDRMETAEAGFVDAAAGWATRSGVDRKTLADIGVPRKVLVAAGIAPTPVGELVRRQYGRSRFTVADLVRTSGVSIASVRGVVAEDEGSGRIQRVQSEGRTVQYRAR